MNLVLRFAAATGLVVAVASAAQPRAIADPAQPGASAPALRHMSALDGYRPLGDTAIGNWRAVNERVREAAAQREQALRASPIPAPPASPAPAEGRRPGGTPVPGGTK
jgi:hypothetical protein